MRVLVCGGRDFSNRGLLWERLDAMHAKEPITLIVNGAAPGADKMSTVWAVSKDYVAIHEHPARWDLYGKAAGPIRNSEMLTENVDVVVAFPGGYGTADMVRKARAKGVPVVEVVSGVDDGGTR